MDFSSPKDIVANTSTGSYVDDDFSPPPFYGSPLTNVYLRERMSAAISAPPKCKPGIFSQTEMPRIRKAPGCEELAQGCAWPSLTHANNYAYSPIPNEGNESSYDDDEEDTLYFVPGLSGVYSPNEWEKLATSPYESYDSWFVQQTYKMPYFILAIVFSYYFRNDNLQENSFSEREFHPDMQSEPKCMPDMRYQTPLVEGSVKLRDI